MKRTTFGTCIRSLRKRNNMTQAQLADILGVTDKAVSKWERDLSYPDIALFPKLVDVLGTTVDALLRACKEDYRPAKLLQAYEVSRDIRTPLHIILGFVEIIRKDHEDPKMLQRYLDGIQVSGEYMMTVLNRILREKHGEGQEDDGDTYPVTQEDLEKYLRERIEARQGEAREFDFAGRRILVAEDMAINREIAGEILKQAGADTEFAEDGQACLEMVEAAPPGYYDLILMDIVMPRMDGMEATRRIRQMPDRERAEIPIIAMTTNVSEQDRRDALAAGMNAFTEKPILVDRLFEMMERLLHQA